MRLFVAVWPSAPVIGQLSQLARPARGGVRWTTSDQWHVTLRFLGEVAAVEAARRALELVRPGEVTAVAGPTVQCLGTSVLCLPVAGLDELASEVVELTTGSGSCSVPAGGGRPFRGHVTLARARRGVDLRPLAGSPLVAIWPVVDVTLVASRLYPEGARYEVLARYPLRPRPAA